MEEGVFMKKLKKFIRKIKQCFKVHNFFIITLVSWSLAAVLLYVIKQNNDCSERGAYVIYH